MVRNILLIFFLLVSFNSFSQKQITKKYSTGEIQEIGYIDKDGKLDSTWTAYDINGKILQQAYYKNGLKVGTWKTYHDNGKIRFEINYVEGSRRGESREYDDTGQVVAIKNY